MLLWKGKKLRPMSKVPSTTENWKYRVMISLSIQLGTRLGMYSHADTSCVNKHALIEWIVEGMRVYEFPFDNRIGKHSDLPIVNAIYTYENPNTFRTIILKIKHVIYIKDKKSTSVPKPSLWLRHHNLQHPPSPGSYRNWYIHNHRWR